MKNLMWTTIILAVALAIAVVGRLTELKAAPNCRQYLDNAVNLMSSYPRGYASNGASAEALAWAKIAEVCTKF